MVNFVDFSDANVRRTAKFVGSRTIDFDLIACAQDHVLQTEADRRAPSIATHFRLATGDGETRVTYTLTSSGLRRSACIEYYELKSVGSLAPL